MGTKESVYIKKEFNSHRTGLGHKHGRRFIVLGHKYDRYDVMWKHNSFWTQEIFSKRGFLRHECWWKWTQRYVLFEGKPVIIKISSKVRQSLITYYLLSPRLYFCKNTNAIIMFLLIFPCLGVTKLALSQTMCRGSSTTGLRKRFQLLIVCYNFSWH